MTGFVGARPRGAFGARGGFGSRGGAHARRLGSGGRADGRVESAAADRGTTHLPRRTLRGVTAIRAQRRQTRVGYAMIGIVVAFLLGLFSLSQTVRVSAMDYDLNSLTANRQQLEAMGRDLRATLARLSSEPAIARRALDAGMQPVMDPVVLPAR